MLLGNRVKGSKSLLNGNFAAYINYLYLLGKQYQALANQEVSSTADEAAKRKAFRKFILSRVTANSDKSADLSENDLLSSLFNILCLLVAWEDSEASWNDTSLTDVEKKKQRQATKFKKDIDKVYRNPIHIGLFVDLASLLARFPLTGDEKASYIKPLLESLESSGTEASLLIANINKFLAYKRFEKKPEFIEQNFKKAAEAISSFKPLIAKIFYGLGIFLAVIAALACGITTGGAIFILTLGWPLWVTIPISVVIFFAGTRANFQLFSNNIPNFFLSLVKSGGVTEFIDSQGKRVQLSTTKKFLLLPAALVSVAVGVASAGITILEGTKILAAIFPMLAVIYPPLPAIIIAILAAVLLIGLSIVMFRAFIGVLQTQFSWRETFAKFIEKIKNLNFTQFLAYTLKAIFIGFALFGLFFLCFTGMPTLAPSLGSSFAYVISLAAFIGDMPFTLVTAIVLCVSLFTKREEVVGGANGLPKKSHFIGQVFEFLALIINALGNAVLVFTDTITSRIASVACFLNSYASNRIQEDDTKLVQARAAATEKAIASLKQPKVQPEEPVQEGTGEDILHTNTRTHPFNRPNEETSAVEITVSNGIFTAIKPVTLDIANGPATIPTYSGL